MTTGSDRYTPMRTLGPFMQLVADEAGRPVALKRPPQAGHAFRLEAWRASCLTGPRFARLLEDGSQADSPYYTLAYAEGPPATLVQPQEVVGCVRQLAEALAALHDRGWVHAALEPLQLRRTEAGLVLVGYGNLTPHGQTALRPGSPAFQSPEQAAGLPLDGRADLYSLGALIHFWLTGETARELELLDLVADPVAELGRWLLSPRPGDRPADAHTLLAALDRVTPARPLERPPEQPPRAPWLVPDRAPRGLAVLESLLDELSAGRGAQLRLVGGAGAGRTTWLDRAAARATAAAWPVLRARGQGRHAAPLAPWRTLYSELVRVGLERQPGLLERCRYRLGRLGEEPGEPPRTPMAPWQADVARERLLASLHELVAGIAEPGLVVLLDDWDQTDEASWRLLAGLQARLAASSPILWIRVESQDAAPAPDILTLPPLGRDEASAMVRGLFHPAPPPDAIDALAQASQGEPWYLTTLAHAWVEQGVVGPHGGPLPPAPTWPVSPLALARLAASAIPEPESWLVGAYIGLLGPQVEPLALEAAAGSFAPGLDALLCSGVVVREGDGRYRYAHPSYHAIYERVLPPTAQVEAARGVLARHPAPMPGERVKLAYTALKADQPAVLAPLALQAARVALAAEALDTARELLEEGLACLAPDHPERGQALALLGEIARRRHEIPAAMQLLEAARELLAGPERGAVALTLAHLAATLGDDLAAVPRWREAAGQATVHPDPDLLAFALAGLANSQAALGEHEAALATGEAALMAAQEASPLPRALAMGALGARLAQAGRERQAEGIALMQRAAGLLEAEGDRQGLVAMHSSLAEAELARGELLFARETAQRARSLASEPHQLGRALLLQAQASWALGEPDAALAEAGAASELALARGATALAAEAAGLLGLITSAREPERGVAWGAQAIAMGTLAPLATRARLWLWHAEGLLAARQFPEAANALYEAGQAIKQGGAQELVGLRGYLLGAWAALTGDRERARQELRATMAQPNQWLVARAALLLGTLAAEAGARTEAAGWLEQARRGALTLGIEPLANEVKRLERGLAPGADGTPEGASKRLLALFEEAKELLPRALQPAVSASTLSAELMASRALVALWETLFDAQDPREMALAMLLAVFAASPARRAFVLSRDGQALAARARNGELPFDAGMVDIDCIAEAVQSGSAATAGGEALAMPLATLRHALGVVYVVGVRPDDGVAMEAVRSIAHAGAIAIERRLLSAPPE